MRKQRRFRAAIINSKMDKAIKAGIIRTVLRRNPLISVLIFNEISDGAQLRRKLPKGWGLVPYEQPGERPGKEGTQYIAVKAKVWALQDSVNHDINEGGRHARRLQGVLLRHKKAKRDVWFLNCHPDPLGLGVEKAPAPARNNQQRQLLEFSSFVVNEADLDPDLDVIIGGDMNQRFALPVGHKFADFHVRNIFADAGLHSAALSVKKPGVMRLLEFFNTDGIKVKRRVGYEPRRFKSDVLDHEIVFAEFQFV